MIATFDGTYDDRMIADQTNPWVERDGLMYSWVMDPLLLPADAPNGVVNDCDGCVGSPVAGTITAMDTEYGIQRCDECQRFQGDLDAALALARLIGGTVRFEIEEED